MLNDGITELRRPRRFTHTFFSTKTGMILLLQNRGTITISKDVRTKLGLEPGDPLDATVENGRLILTPVAMIPKTLVLSELGEKMEVEADEDIRQGRVYSFDSMDKLIESLEKNDPSPPTPLLNPTPAVRERGLRFSREW